MADTAERVEIAGTGDTAPHVATYSPPHGWRVRTKIRINASNLEILRTGVLATESRRRFADTRAIPQTRPGAVSLHAIGLVHLDSLGLRRVRFHAT